MPTFIALAGNKDLLTDVSEEISGDLEWLFNLPQERLEDSKDILALYEGRDFDEEDSDEDEDKKNRTKAFRERVWSQWLM